MPWSHAIFFVYFWIIIHLDIPRNPIKNTPFNAINLNRFHLPFKITKLITGISISSNVSRALVAKSIFKEV